MAESSNLDDIILAALTNGDASASSAVTANSGEPLKTKSSSGN